MGLSSCIWFWLCPGDPRPHCSVCTQASVHLAALLPWGGLPELWGVLAGVVCVLEFSQQLRRMSVCVGLMLSINRQQWEACSRAESAALGQSFLGSCTGYLDIGAVPGFLCIKLCHLSVHSCAHQCIWGTHRHMQECKVLLAEVVSGSWTSSTDLCIQTNGAVADLEPGGAKR